MWHSTYILTLLSYAQTERDFFVQINDENNKFCVRWLFNILIKLHLILLYVRLQPTSLNHNNDLAIKQQHQQQQHPSIHQKLTMVIINGPFLVLPPPRICASTY